tara:strand:+ start:66 stop:572 length:507 start_codon:yes stop_codon:yes gene_type:complete
MAISAGDFLSNWSNLLASGPAFPGEPGRPGIPTAPPDGRPLLPGEKPLPLPKFASDIGNIPYEIAANVLVPNPTGEQSDIYIDYPSLPNVEQGGYRALGRFGDTTDEYKDYGFTTTQPGSGDLIRGQMDFVPGGIPASATFNREESLKAYPDYMEGIPEGNMPVFRYY